MPEEASSTWQLINHCRLAVSFQRVWNNLSSSQANYYFLIWTLCITNSIVLSLCFPYLISVLNEIFFPDKNLKILKWLQDMLQFGSQGSCNYCSYLILIFRVCLFFSPRGSITRFDTGWVMLSDLSITFIKRILATLPLSHCGPNVSQCSLNLVFCT